MSDSQFAYGGLTLDELRSLAASPQVGTMQAMPQSFRALADRVGEVADLLAHAQADLPNWWKGPAAEQAAATLGRAAAEAREFHESAMGAATAVGRCAQVVAEQQNQMMNVPEVPEPGVTAVVQRPATPLEALEAARQSASYQAAHEQAVQVVNGIAAQYLETRDELATATTTSGENLGNLRPLPGAPQSNAAPSRSSDSDVEYETPTHSQPGLTRAGSTAYAIADSNYLREKQATIEPGRARRTSTEFKPVESQAPALPFKTNTPPRLLEHITAETGEATRPAFSPGGIGPTVNKSDRAPNTPDENVTPPINTPAQPYIELGSPHALRPDVESALGNELISSRRQSILRGKSTSEKPKTTSTNRYSKHVDVGQERPLGAVDTERPSVHNYSNGSRDSALPEPTQLQSDNSNIANASAIPPYFSIGYTGRPPVERNPRPAYLKERKSTWLPDTVAAPPDGVIGPDCSLHP